MWQYHGVMFDGDRHRGKNDEATSLLPSSRASTDSATPGLPSCRTGECRRSPHCGCYCLFYLSRLKQLIAVTLLGDHIHQVNKGPGVTSWETTDFDIPPCGSDHRFSRSVKNSCPQVVEIDLSRTSHRWFSRGLSRSRSA